MTHLFHRPRKRRLEAVSELLQVGMEVEGREAVSIRFAIEFTQRKSLDADCLTKSPLPFSRSLRRAGPFVLRGLVRFAAWDAHMRGPSPSLYVGQTWGGLRWWNCNFEAPAQPPASMNEVQF